MAKAVVTCGKVCSGKTTYAQRLRIKLKGVVLSIDEVMLSLFSEPLGDLLDYYVDRVKTLLLNKSLELVEVGVNVILDWGLWTKVEKFNAIFEQPSNEEIDVLVNE